MSSASIVIPAYNAAATLEATLESVFKQSRGDWEAIIVDDGSWDNTAGLVRGWCARDSRFRLVSGAQAGLAAARNRGARHASAPWLVFLDADDLILPDYLASMLPATSDNSRPDLIYCAGARLTPDGRLGEAEMAPSTDHFRHLADRNIFFVHSCLVRHAIFDELGGFDPSLTSCEDWDLWQRLARCGAIFTAVAECLTHYRMRPESMSRDAGTLLGNGRRIILRAHASDPRVRNASPVFANGLPPEQVGSAILGFTIWCAGVMIGSGKDPDCLLRLAEFPSLSNLDHGRAAGFMQYGVPWGACMLQADWPSLCSDLSEPIRRAFLRLENRCGVAGLANECLAQLGLEAEPAGGKRLKGQPTSSWTTRIPPVGDVEFGDLLRVQPVSKAWGYDRGTPIDRLYIESFLDRHRDDIRGRVLEIGDNAYTRRFGANRVTRSDVLHIQSDVPNVTIVADLTMANHIDSDLFDCVILTQTLQYIFELSEAIRTLARILKPGGVVLLTVPGISQVGYDEWEKSRYWSLTSPTVRRLLSKFFPANAIQVESRGNLFTSVAFLQGLSQEDIAQFDHEWDDPHYQLTILARVVKPDRQTTLRATDPTAENVRSHVVSRFLHQLRNPEVASVMVVVAHPDDELIGAGAHLGFWPGLTVVYTTNGAARADYRVRAAGFADSATYAATRRREGETALAMAGLTKDRIHGLDVPDLEASFRLVDMTWQLAGLFAVMRPAVVVTHPYEGGHPDHDATCFAVQAAWRLMQRAGFPAPALVEMSSYFGPDGVRMTATFLEKEPPSVSVQLDEMECDKKRRMFLCHASQKDLTHIIPIGVECFRPARAYDFREPPHSGRLFYEYHDLGMESARWLSLAAAALRELGDEC